MLMTVMPVGVMQMLMPNPRVPVPVAMRLSGRIGRCMVVPVMDIVHMAMFMSERLMQVLEVVHLGEVQMDATPGIFSSSSSVCGTALRLSPNRSLS